MSQRHRRDERLDATRSVKLSTELDNAIEELAGYRGVTSAHLVRELIRAHVEPALLRERERRAAMSASLVCRPGLAVECLQSCTKR